MNETKLDMETVLARIDQTLNILNMISKDLVEISKALKSLTGPVGSVKDKVEAINEVRVLFSSELEEMLKFEETKKYIMIRPRRYLGTENFVKIASIIRDSGGEYISAGKDSHFRIPKKI